MVQLDTGPTRAGANGRLVPSRLATVWSSLARVANAALRAIFPVWRTIPTPWLWWLAGLYPEYLLDRERARWRSRVEMLPANHPLHVRLAQPPYRGWSRLHQAASGLGARPQWEPKRLGVRAWLGLPLDAPKRRRVPPPDMRGWWRANKPASALWDGHTAKPFLERFSRQCLSRWLAEASGHGDFSEYHVRFNHPRGALKECPCGRVVFRGHFFSCPLAIFNNPLAGRLDLRAFWTSFQLFRSRASQIELWGQAWDAATGRLIPTLRPLHLPLRTRPQSHRGIDPDTDSSESESELEIHIPGFVQV